MSEAVRQSSDADGVDGKRGWLGGALAGNTRPCVIGAIVTLVVELAVPAVALVHREPHPWSYLFGGGGLHANEAFATVAVCVLWMALAVPLLAAFGRGAWDALFRGGIVIDVSAITLLVLWLLCEQVTFAAAVKIYCVLASLGLAGIAATRLARTPAGRCAWATAVAAVTLVLLASPFWIGGVIHNQPHVFSESVVEAAVLANPFYAATAAMGETTRFVWHQATVMYRITRIGDYAAAPPLSWYPAVIIYLVAAAALAVVAAVSGRVRRRLSQSL